MRYMSGVNFPKLKLFDLIWYLYAEFQIDTSSDISWLIVEDIKKHGQAGKSPPFWTKMEHSIASGELILKFHSLLTKKKPKKIICSSLLSLSLSLLLSLSSRLEYSPLFLIASFYYRTCVTSIPPILLYIYMPNCILPSTHSKIALKERDR